MVLPVLRLTFLEVKMLLLYVDVYVTHTPLSIFCRCIDFLTINNNLVLFWLQFVDVMQSVTNSKDFSHRDSGYSCYGWVCSYIFTLIKLLLIARFTFGIYILRWSFQYKQYHCKRTDLSKLGLFIKYVFQFPFSCIAWGSVLFFHKIDDDYWWLELHLCILIVINHHFHSTNLLWFHDKYFSLKFN